MRIANYDLCQCAIAALPYQLTGRLQAEQCRGGGLCWGLMAGTLDLGLCCLLRRAKEASPVV